MPVIDTEVLFALNPKDPKHFRAIRLLKSEVDLRVSDSAVIEFQLVLRGRGRNPVETREAILAVSKVLLEHRVHEVKTLDTATLALQCAIESRLGLSYFDSLIAASALVVDSRIVSDDTAFDRVPGLNRILLM
jgi:predicted nucleic acid-binding protein